jgi:uncharacterized protein
MKMLVIADDDTIEQRIQCSAHDVLVSCGDMPDAIITRISEVIRPSHILAVKGNHDSSGSFALPIVDLHLKQYLIDGVRFGGFQGSWRYKPCGNYLFEQDEVDRLLVGFPPVDVFVAHNSPRHIHDRDDEVHFGFDAFTAYINRARPRLFIHGHQHINQETQVGHTKVVGIYGFRSLEIPG